MTTLTDNPGANTTPSDTKPKKKRISGRGCKAKGSEFERELAILMSDLTGLNIRRTPLSGSFSMIRGVGSADLTGTPLLWIEAKRTETVNVHSALAQAKRGCDAHGNNDMPVVITRRNRQSLEQSLCIMELKDFMKLYNALLRQNGYTRPADPVKAQNLDLFS